VTIISAYRLHDLSTFGCLLPPMGLLP